MLQVLACFQKWKLFWKPSLPVSDLLQIQGIKPLILYFIIVREPTISASIAVRGLKFWLQVALSAPIATAWTQIWKSGSGKSGFSGIFFSLFFASTDLLGPQGHPPDVPVPPNPDPDREIRFFENPDFSFFRLFKLKDPTIWVCMDSPGPT